MTRYGMAIDTKRCVACATCVVGCKVENNCPEGILYSHVVNVGGVNPDSPSGTYPILEMSTYTISCQHCEKPACLGVCASGAIEKRDDGIVVQDLEKCIGCKLCLEACPYDGVRTLLEGDPVYYTDFAMGGIGAPDHLANTVEKCTLCVHRVDAGQQPFCVEVCPGRARVFGDLDDPESDISKLLASREHHQLQTEDGTGPSLYYLD